MPAKNRFAASANLILTALLIMVYSDYVSAANILKVGTDTADNGLQVIYHHRDDSDTFSAQLVVNVGLRDFSCDDKQLPHLLEHMLLEGTKRFDRKTLRQRIRNLGGSTSAYTRMDTTYFTISLHSDYPDVALDTLFSLISEPRFEAKDFERSKQIIHAEQGSSSHSLMPMSKSIPVLTETAKAQLFGGSELFCETLSSPDHLQLDQIRALHRTHYVASNMTLIVIGHFRQQRIHQLLRESFLRLPLTPRPERQPLPHTQSDFAPVNANNALLNPEASLYLYLPAVPLSHPHRPHYSIIAEYLSEQLFYEVRGSRGLGYTPRARLEHSDDVGFIEATTKTSAELLPDARAAFLEQYRTLLDKGIPRAEVSRIQHKQILEFESKQRDHDDLAEIYRQYRAEIRQHGALPDLVGSIRQVTATQVNQVIRSELPAEPLVATLVRPPLYQVALQIIFSSIVITTLAWPLWRWSRRRNRPRS